MPDLYLVANSVLFSPFGHLQLVLDPGGGFGDGDETELEVLAPDGLSGAWDVRPEQPLGYPAGAEGRPVRLEPGAERDAGAVWTLLLQARDAVAADPAAYHLGLLGDAEGQNSNSYVTTLAHAVGLDIAGALDSLLALPEFDAFPGVARNVLFDRLGPDGAETAPSAMVLDGTAGRDVARGGAGDDRLGGRGGADELRGFAGADEIEGGAGRDRLFGQAGDDRIDGGAGRDTLGGGGGADLLSGGTGGDRIRGGAGSDGLAGGAGDDRLFGQAGRDELEGGAGDDVMTGGRGRDRFHFDESRDEGTDRITDFDPDLDRLVFKAVPGGRIDIAGGADAVLILGSGTEITLIGVAASAIDPGDLIFV